MHWRERLGVAERRWKKAPDEEVLPAKTLWDWLQLLIVPAILIAVTFAWSATQTRSDNKREDRRIAADRAAAEEARQDATLQAYLNEMSGLMLDKKLLTSKKSDAVRAVARTVTLTALRRLDGERKAAVVRFLSEAQLLRGQTPLVLLAGANLEYADLAETHLEGVDLEGTDLTYASLREAILRDANLEGSYLGATNLEGTNFEGANLQGANLVDADLVEADLKGANLKGANIVGVILTAAQRKQATNVPP
jgi:hypothetical protein